LLQRTGSEVEFYFIAFEFSFTTAKFFRRQLAAAFDHIYALRTDGGQQVVKVFGRVHIVRYEVVDLAIREIALLLAGIDQFFDIVEFVVKSQLNKSPLACVAVQRSRDAFWVGGNRARK